MKKRARILIIDDSATALALMGKVLEAMGQINYLQVDNGMTALKKLNSENFDLVLLDWSMPKVSGIDLLRNIKSSKKLSWIPVIMITAESDTERVKEAMMLGVNDYLVKPINAEALKQKIRKALKGRELQM